jgi:Spy/CpxP family protein refolding chaperone
MTPQREPLEEIRTLARRLSAFGDAEVQSQLQLTDEQREQIRAILRAGFQEAQAIRKSLATAQKTILEKAAAVLTDEQRARWEQIQKQHFEVEQEAGRPMGPGGPGMGGPGMRRQRIGGPGMRGRPDLDASE